MVKVSCCTIFVHFYNTADCWLVQVQTKIEKIAVIDPIMGANLCASILLLPSLRVVQNRPKRSSKLQKRKLEAWLGVQMALAIHCSNSAYLEVKQQPIRLCFRVTFFP